MDNEEENKNREYTKINKTKKICKFSSNNKDTRFNRSVKLSKNNRIFYNNIRFSKPIVAKVIEKRDIFESNFFIYYFNNYVLCKSSKNKNFNKYKLNKVKSYYLDNKDIFEIKRNFKVGKF